MNGYPAQLIKLIINACDENACLTSSGYCVRQDILVPEGLFRDTWAKSLVRLKSNVAIRHQYDFGFTLFFLLSLGDQTCLNNVHVDKKINPKKETVDCFFSEIIVDVVTAREFVRSVLGVYSFDYTGITTISLKDAGNISTKSLSSVFSKFDL